MAVDVTVTTQTPWASNVERLRNEIVALAAQLRRIPIGDVDPSIARLIADSLEDQPELLASDEIARLQTDMESGPEAERWIRLAEEHIETLVALKEATD